MGKLSGLVSLCMGLSVVVLLTACDTQKQPAQAAYAQIEASVAPVRETLEQYAPAEYEQLNELMENMKARLNAKDYQGALAVQPLIMARLASVSSAAAKKRNDVLSRLSSEWRTLAALVPGMINQLNVRLGALQDMSRLPGGISRDAMKRVRLSLPELTSDWKAAMEYSRRNDFRTAVDKAKAVHKRCEEFAALLGTQFSG